MSVTITKADLGIANLDAWFVAIHPDWMFQPDPSAPPPTGRREVLYFNGLTILNSGDKDVEAWDGFRYEILDETGKVLRTALRDTKTLRTLPVAYVPGVPAYLRTWYTGNFIDITGLPDGNYYARFYHGPDVDEATFRWKRNGLNAEWFDWSSETGRITAIEEEVKKQGEAIDELRQLIAPPKAPVTPTPA